MRLDQAEYAVVDVETTGLFPQRHDRVVEVAVVRIDGHGEELHEYVTLVNPERDVGPTSIHGIEASDLLGAPKFSEIAGDLIEHLKNSVVVGHNVRFDIGFLRSEYRRIGEPLPLVPLLCTLWLGRKLDMDTGGWPLSECCDYFSIPQYDIHTALGDTCATAELLSLYLKLAQEKGLRTLADLGCDVPMPPDTSWPKHNSTGHVHTRQHAKTLQTARYGYLSTLVQRLPSEVSGSPEVAAYLDLLDRMLDDRIIEEQEAGALLEVAEEWGLSCDVVVETHRRYLRILVATALEDGVLSQLEVNDLLLVARVLNICEDELEQFISEGTAENEKGTQSVGLVGQSVCFTGELWSGLSRDEAEELAARAGLVVRKNVTKGLDILVVADPDTMSGKARKARDYGIRILAEGVFWKKAGINI